VAPVQDVQLRLREDVVTEANHRDANQRAAGRRGGLFLVPKVIE
jgi:aspartyl-tRNA(Asn)/glutamyl-tRNA(Gln) amidotransferase subunit C